jgi:RHS repeat-associated protein
LRAVSAIAIGVAVCVLASVAPVASAQTYNPSTRIGTASLIDPSAADTFYGSSTTSTNGLGLTTRPNEIRELARALHDDADQIYDYVRNNIEIAWMYGLQKGALGAYLDRSGTAFDQAKLMVDLLHEAGYTASYVAGTITLSGSQFSDWSGITSAQAACQLLSSGGIPASINGSTTADCSYSGSVSTITLSHVWVSVHIGSSDYVFDPAYKPHDVITGINLNTATGLTAGQALSNATSGMSSGTNSGVGYVRTLNAASLNSTLQGYGANLLSYINTNAPAAELDQIVGGSRIHRYEIPSGGLRQTTLPYTSSTQHTWTGGVPDQYRTTLRVEVSKFVSGGTSMSVIIDNTLYVDEIYGRKLVVVPNIVKIAPGNSGTTTITLRLTDEAGADVTTSPLGSYSATETPSDRAGSITLSANHPYVARAEGSSTDGTYMDDTVVKSVTLFVPLVVMNAWGDANVGDADIGLNEAWGARRDTPFNPPAIPGCDTSNTCTSLTQDLGDSRREQEALNWMLQVSRAARLHAAIANGIYTHHHSLGVVASDTVVHGTIPFGSTTVYYTLADGFDRFDVDDGFSFTSTTANSTDRRAAIYSIAATQEALEGSIPAQNSDLPETTSTATRFEWANSPPSDDDFSGGYGARRFYQFNSGNASQAATLAIAEGQTSGGSPSTTCPSDPTSDSYPALSDAEVQGRRTVLANAVSTYANAGFDVVAAEDGFLGPGRRFGDFWLVGAACNHNPSHQRGGAFVATRLVSGDPVEIAHIAVDLAGNLKGGGGGAQASTQGQYDPSKAADVLRARFVDHSTALGVDLRNGEVTYSSPAALSVGNGDFPYRLSANLIWRGGVNTEISPMATAHTQPQTPWTTNWNTMLSVASSGLEALGQTDVRAAAGTIAAFLAQQDIYKASASTQRDVAGVLAASWWVSQIAGNEVTVSIGASTRQFVQNVNGQYFLPGGGETATISQTGARAMAVDASCDNANTLYHTQRGWSYAGMSFIVTNAHGDTQTFPYWDSVLQPGDNTCAHVHGFRLTSWSFPKGVSVTLSYSLVGVGDLPILTEVSNSLGRKIRFNHQSNSDVVSGFDNELIGADSHASTFGFDINNNINSITDAAGAQTRFTTSLVGDHNVLTEVYQAYDTTTPSLRYTYDSLGRVMEAQDAVALQVGGRNPYNFYIAGHYRGERVDPAGGSYVALYDWRRRPFRFTDELGRVTSAAYDGRSRVTAYTYPELDQEQLAYDDRNNITQLTRVAKPSSGLANIVIGAAWDSTWNRPDSITDALGYRTDFTYVASGNGAGEMATAVRPAPSGSTPVGSGSRPTYTYTYGSFGRLATSTDPSGVVTSSSINATTGNIDSTTLDPTGINATTSFSYTANGDASAASDPRGNATETSYDVIRRPTVVLHHNGGTSAALLAAERTTYDLLGQVTKQEGGTAFSGTSVTTWLTRETRTYTPTGKVATVVDALSDTTTNAYDPLDRLLSVTDPVSRVTRYTYDLAGQQTVETRAYGTSLQQDYATYTFTANGQRASVKDANGNLSSYVYDGFDRLSELHFPSTTLGVGTSSSTDYEAYGYDANSNRTSLRLRSSETIAFTYDNLNRQIVKDIPGGTSADVYTSYDAAGRVVSALFSSTSGQGIAYGYDSAGRLTSEANTMGTSLAMSFQYDAASNRTRVIWPDSNYAQYVYDAMNRVANVEENGATSGAGVLGTYSYDALGRRATVTRGDGSTATFTYDNASRLTQLAQDLSGTVNDQTLGFSFTAASQISQRTASNDNFNWITPAASRSYTANGLNQYTNVGGSAFNYDARGNLISDGSRNFAYDYENRLTSVSGSSSLTLAYDPLGRLQTTTASSVSTTYLYDGDRLSAEYNSSGTLLRRYVHGPGVDEPLVWYEGSGLTDRRYLVTDNQGTVIAEDGAAVVRYMYGPYGEPNAWSGSRFRYTGQIALPEVQLYHYKARVYDPVLGRFLQTDPVGYKDEINLYTIVHNDPLNHADPNGEATLGLDVSLEAAIGLGADVDVQLSFDTTTHEVNLDAQAGLRAGLALQAGVQGFAAHSNGARGFAARGSLTAQASAGGELRPTPVGGQAGAKVTVAEASISSRAGAHAGIPMRVAPMAAGSAGPLEVSNDRASVGLAVGGHATAGVDLHLGVTVPLPRGDSGPPHTRPAPDPECTVWPGHC